MSDLIEGVPGRVPDPISHSAQDYNDPLPDSLFRKRSAETNECSICGTIVYNNTESRDGHLNRKGCHAAASPEPTGD